MLVAPQDGGANNSEMQKTKEAHARKALQALGKKIEDLRVGKRWNRTTLAHKAGVTIATVRGLEDGTKVTQPKKLRAVAQALGVSVKRLETDDTKDPRVKNWSDEDYEIGNWYHNAPRALKNRIWALQELVDAHVALLDAQFAPLLDGWAKLDQDQKNFVLNSFRFMAKPAAASDDIGGVDALAPADPKVRGPHR